MINEEELSDKEKRFLEQRIYEEGLSDEELLAVLLGKMFEHFCSFIEEKGLGSDFAKWMIHDRNEVLIDLVRLGGVGDRIIEEAEK